MPPRSRGTGSPTGATIRARTASALKAITPANVGTLRAQWSFQFGGGQVETTPLVVDGMMFVTGPLNDADALDARTGSRIWHYSRPLPKVASHCTVMTNRGFAVLGDRLYLATLDSHLVALNAKSGNVIFDVEVVDYKKGFSITHAPLALDGKIIVGVTAGECALTGFLDAYDAGHGQASLAHVFDRATGRSEPRELGRKFGGIRRRPHLDDGHLRRRHEHAVLGDRKSGTGLQREVARRRQSVHQRGARPGSGDREDEMVVPVHAARYARLGRNADAGADRRHGAADKNANCW